MGANVLPFSSPTSSRWCFVFARVALSLLPLAVHDHLKPSFLVHLYPPSHSTAKCAVTTNQTAIASVNPNSSANLRVEPTDRAIASVGSCIVDAVVASPGETATPPANAIKSRPTNTSSGGGGQVTPLTSHRQPRQTNPGGHCGYGHRHPQQQQLHHHQMHHAGLSFVKTEEVDLASSQSTSHHLSSNDDTIHHTHIPDTTWPTSVHFRPGVNDAGVGDIWCSSLSHGGIPQLSYWLVRQPKRERERTVRTLVVLGHQQSGC